MDTSQLLDTAAKLKSGLMAAATNGSYADSEFKQDLSILMSDNRIEKMVPSYVKASHRTDDFRRTMQAKFEHYVDRRKFIEDELAPIFNYLESLRTGADAFSSNLESYQLGKSVGNGGYGTVYRFHHKLLEYDFAIKIFEPIFVSDSENIEGEKRFFREARILFRLSHKNIVRVYDIGRIEGKPFIRMEFVEGYTLQSFLEKYGIVSFERSLKPIIALLEGLSYAHELGVIHRDLKPTNFMVTNSGEFKIIDFGISAFLDNEKHSKLTKTGENIVGSAFSDPVLINTPKLRDVRSDIYSVGAIWYNLLVGIAPIGGDIRQALLKTGNATPLQTEIILKCLSSNIDDRFDSCKEILAMIKPTETSRSNTTPIRASDKRITEITRDEIFQYLIDGFNNDMENYVYSQYPDHQQPERVFAYYGRKSMIDFLKRVYNFDSIPSSETDFEKELIRHTVTNDDYSYDWVFKDERLQLPNGNDEVLLKFLAEMFRPTVRSEKSSWEVALNYINDLLRVDGYELCEIEKISGRSVYGYKYFI